MVPAIQIAWLHGINYHDEASTLCRFDQGDNLEGAEAELRSRCLWSRNYFDDPEPKPKLSTVFNK